MFNVELLNTFQSEFNFSSKIISLSTDSRSYSSEGLFICLAGENFDGFSFVEQVLIKNCKIIVFKNSKANLSKRDILFKKYSDVSFISTNDPLELLQSLAKKRIDQFKEEGHSVFAITGSNGKTTTKEMLFKLLQSVFKEEVFATKGNLNNHIGVPLTILSAPIECTKLIVEMGSNHLGELALLCEIAKPEFGIISNVGAAHIGLFGSLDNIFKEKKSLYDYVLLNKTVKSKFVINNNDDFLSKIPSGEVLTKFGNVDSDYSLEFETNGFSFIFKEKEVVIKNVNIFEKYNLENLASALILCLDLFPEKVNDFVTSANSYQIPALNRSEWLEVGGKEIFLDAYNANPTSMTSSLNSFKSNLERKQISMSDSLFILGDMNELGDYTQAEHKKIGTLLSSIGAEKVCFVGQYAKYYKEGFPAGETFPTKSSLEEKWPTLSQNHKVIFIKASRSLQLESLVDIT
ncbi:hypothetical protein A9Q84_21085 [Halobacteriovorax marinus]|uniref:UDP-N-acetylmuramoyl-tripeptide--D-alanyl-D-alanine ligase n=1 Tax=Halobacteriovorax marinus TaxID=97084 RepID=A0A1Y5F6X2_9BACT|nr:hypothetical protein A9Q84_21085 [Halobacteriovorax marinus]